MMNAKLGMVEVESNTTNSINDGTAFKQFYHGTLKDKGVSQFQEAYSLDRSQSTVAQYVSPYTNQHLPVYLAVRSTIGDDILGWMAEQRGGVYMAKYDGLDGKIKEEVCNAQTELIEVVRCNFSATESKLHLQEAAKQIAKALEELG